MPTQRTVTVTFVATIVWLGCAGSAVASSGKGEVPAANSGEHGSRCKAMTYTGADPGADPTLDTTSLGSAAPASYELAAPTSQPDQSQPVRRVMIFVHGGGWYWVGRRLMRSERESATKWRATGWQTASIDYRACRKSVHDVLRFYDLIRERVGPDVPICLQGQSAGGHLALMVAAKRSDVACVITQGGPTDLRRLARQGVTETHNQSSLGELKHGSAHVQGWAIAAFGKRRLRALSPITHARRIRARLLLATAENDTLIPHAQAETLATAVRAAHSDAYVDVDRLASGSIDWIHGSVSHAANREFQLRVARVVAPFGRAPDIGIIPPPLPFIHSLPVRDSRDAARSGQPR